MPKTATKTIRMEPAMLRHLERMAAQQRRSVNNLVENILEDYLETEELLKDPEFLKALEEDRKGGPATPWRNVLRSV